MYFLRSLLAERVLVRRTGFTLICAPETNEGPDIPTLPVRNCSAASTGARIWGNRLEGKGETPTMPIHAYPINHPLAPEPRGGRKRPPRWGGSGAAKLEISLVNEPLYYSPYRHFERHHLELLSTSSA